MKIQNVANTLCMTRYEGWLGNWIYTDECNAIEEHDNQRFFFWDHGQIQAQG